MRFLKRRGCDRGTAVRLQHNQIFRREPLQRPPDDRSAHAELLADRIFRELCSRLQGLLHDGASQRFIHGIDTRESLHLHRAYDLPNRLTSGFYHKPRSTLLEKRNDRWYQR